ncbi:MAG: PDZ domain-containing protein, partial [Kofleriaceae bacterium]|nr:PDZ domain-containing protein [Kofleriaceae bacterium]
MRLFLLPVLVVLACCASWGVGLRDASATPKEQVHKAWLGVSISAAYGGVRVDEVIPDTPADMAGIQRGDIIIGIDGSKTPTP